MPVLFESFLARQAHPGRWLGPQAAHPDPGAATGAHAVVASFDALQRFIDVLQLGQLDLKLSNVGIGLQVGFGLFAHLREMIGHGHFSVAVRLVQPVPDRAQHGLALQPQLRFELLDVVLREVRHSKLQGKVEVDTLAGTSIRLYR